jgi:tetratricopeptide (TPR) repeat protein
METNLQDRNRQARALLDGGKPAEARAFFLEILSCDKSFAPAWHGAGLAFLKLCDFEDALNHFSTASRLEPNNPWHRHGAGAALLSMGKPEAAERTYLDILQLDSQFATALERLAQIRSRQGDREGALAYWERASDAQPDNLQFQNKVGLALIDLGRLADAAAAFDRVLVREPRFAPALGGLAQVCRAKGDRQAALGHLIAASQAEPENLSLRRNVGSALVELGRLDEAEQCFKDILQSDAKFALALTGLGQVSQRRGDHESALNHFQRASEVGPESPWILSGIFDSLRALGRLDEAEAYARKIVAAKPESAQALVDLAQVVRLTRETSAAIEILERAIRIDAAHSGARIALASEFQAVGRLDDAERLYKAVLQSDAANVSASLGLGHLARKRGQRGVARDIFASLAERAGDTRAATVEVIEDLIAERSFDEARRRAAILLAAHPDDLAALTKAAQIEVAAGEFGRALAAYADVVERFPRHIPAHIEIAALEMRNGTTANAIEALQHALLIQPNHPEALERLASVASSIGEGTVAANILRRVARLQPGRSWAPLHMARELARLGKHAQAVTIIEGLVAKFGPRPEFYIYAGEILTAAGFAHAARRWLDEGCEAYPGNFNLWRQSCALSTRLGRFDEVERKLAARPECIASEALDVEWIRVGLAAARSDVRGALDAAERGFAQGDRDLWRREFAARLALLALDMDAADRHVGGYLEILGAQRSLHAKARKLSLGFTAELRTDIVLNRGILTELQEIAASPAEQRILGALDLISRYPEYTLAGMSLFVWLRQSATLTALSVAKQAPGVNRIPRRIVQFWHDEAPPDDVKTMCESWELLNPSFDYERFSLASARRFLDENGGRDVVTAFDRATEPERKADIFRLAYLFKHGGFYADADDRCVAPLELAIAGGRDLIVYQEEIGSLGNDFLGAVPEHPAIGLALANAVEAMNRGDKDVPWLCTGPGLLTRSVAEFLSKEAQPLAALASILVLDRHELLSAVAIHCWAAYKGETRDWSGTGAARKREALRRHFHTVVGDVCLEMPSTRPLRENTNGEAQSTE